MVDYFYHSINNLKRRGIRSWLTLLGIFIGILAVTSLITVGNGLQEAVNSQFGISSTQVISVQAGGLSFGAPGSNTANPLTLSDSEAISRLSGVEFAVPRNIEFVKTEYNNQVEFVYSTNVINGLEREIYEILGIETEHGRLLSSGDSGKIVIGNNLQYGDKNGYDRDFGIGKTILIEGEKFAVVGILEKKGSFILDNIIIMIDRDLDKIANYGEEVDVIGVKVRDKDSIDKIKENIEKLMRDRRNVKKGEEDFEVSTPQATLDQVNSVLNGIQIFIVIIASISIFVGTIGIVNTMATSVVERRKEIGIMKSIGAKNKHIFMMFFVESGMLGLIGGLLGVIFGLLIGYFGTLAINSYVGATTNPSINLYLIVFNIIGSFIIGSIAGIIPAMNAAKQNPVEALRA